MSKKHQILHDVQIQKIGHKGVGIATHANGKKIIVKGNVIPGSTVSCITIKKKKDFIEAKLIDVKERPKDVQLETPPCPHYVNPTTESTEFTESTEAPVSGCGGCKRQLFPYSVQAQLKMNVVLDSFRGCEEILRNTHIYEILEAPAPYHYRNKIEFSFGKFLRKDKETGQRKDNAQHRNCGFHKQGMFSKVIDVDQCFLISTKAHRIFSHIKQLCKDSGLPVHDQKSHEGFFRHLVIREGVNTNNILVNLVIAHQKLENQHQEEQRNLLQKTFLHDPFLKEEVTTFCITHNNGLADIVKGTDITMSALRGDAYIHEKLMFNQEQAVQEKNLSDTNISIIEEGQMKIIETNKKEQTTQTSANKIPVSFRISPFSFFQTNTHAAELLYQTAINMTGDIKGTILDLYCGTGSIGISFLKANKGNFVMGIEIVNDAIIDANHNAQINNIADQSYFVAGKAEELVHEDSTIQQKIHELGLVIVDPPRDGLHKNVIKFLNTLKKQHQCKLLYISCNPVTMARDIQGLSEGGRKLQELQPVDMFPQTYHIETIGTFN